MLPHQDGSGRHSEGAGRRPLVVSGQSRQMLQNINENLQYATRRHHEQQLQQQQHSIVAVNSLGAMSMHPELTQSTPNLQGVDKTKLTAGAGGKPQDRLGYNQQALLEIRQSLQGFQIMEEEGHGPVWHQPNALTTDAILPNKHFLQQLKDMGWDEGIACRALQISGNKSVDAAVLLMQALSNEGRNGFAKLNVAGLPRYGSKVIRKPSFEEKYHPGSSANSENSSVRSESPGMGSQRHFLEPPRCLQPPVLRPNERLTPPPVPPRGVPAGSLRKGYTPPPPPPPVPHEEYDSNMSSMASFLHRGGSSKPAYTLASVPCAVDLVANSAYYPDMPGAPSSSGQPGDEAVVSVGHVKQMIRRMSAPPDTPLMRATGNDSPLGPPSTPGRQPMRPTQMESHPFLFESRHISCEDTVSENSPGQSPIPARTSNHQSTASYGQGSQLLPDKIQTPYMHSSPSPQASPSPSPASTPLPGHKLTKHMHIIEPQPATVQAWGAKQQAIITQQVKSREVAKPVLQTATAPQVPLISEAGNFMSNHSISPGPKAGYGGGFQPHYSSPSSQEPYASYCSPVDSPVNYPSPAQTPPPVPPRNVQVDITQRIPQQYMVQGGPQIDLSFRSITGQRMHVTHYAPNGRSLEMSPQQPPLPPRTHPPMNHGIGAVPRTSSPAMRTLNQSPLSIISTTSTPSSNSDIPDKPPPPYPGRPSHSNLIHSPAQNYILPDDLSSNSDRMSEITATDSQPEQDTASDTSSSKSGLKRQFAELLQQTKLNQKLPPQAYKFYMEQHIENLMKNTDERRMRAEQLELEMSKVGLSEEAQKQMRRMLRQKESNYIRLKRAKMSRDMFKKINTLGVGAFGEVALVRKRDTEVLYAMKTLRKSDILQRNQAAHVKAERDILAEADNEWVVKLYYSFQDDHNLYFIMDYIPGGDLMSLLIKDGIFTHDRALFYIAELVLAIDSVHRMGFIHRDIKPDNILIDKDGHIKLTDFGLCTGFRWTHNSKYYQKGSHIRQDSMDMGEHVSNHCHCGEEHLQDLKRLELRKARHQRCLAHSLVGTPNYIAPEVLLRRGYTACCDWWSVGVILYEMLVGKPPFYASDPAEIQRKVINWHKELHIPSIARLAPAAIDIIKRLCCDAQDRLGAKGPEEVKSHLFFKGIDWLNLRKQPASYVPVIRHPTDISNFDPVDPDKIRDSEDDGSTGSVIYRDRIPENGKQPDHAFYEFTFRRFFDEGGQLILPSHDTLFLEECDTSSENSVNTKEEDSSPVYV